MRHIDSDANDKLNEATELRYAAAALRNMGDRDSAAAVDRAALRLEQAARTESDR